MQAHNRRYLSFLLLAIGGLLATAQVKVAPHEEDGGLIQKRFEYFYGQRAFPLGRIPTGARLRALEQLRAMEAAEKAEPGVAKAKWKQVRPQPINPAQKTEFGGWPTDSGRVTALAVDPTNAKVVYLGAAEGGVWKTTDAGAHWTPLTDKQASLAVGSIAIDPTNPKTIYVGTGEANFCCSVSDDYYGAGILKSTDGGSNWTLLGGGPGGEFSVCESGNGSLSSMFAGAYIGSIAIDPANNQVLLAGVANCPSNGIFRSTDGGATWARVLPPSNQQTSGAPGTAVLFASGSTAYAASGNVSGDSANGVYESTDNGATWSPMNGTGSRVVPSGKSVGRISLVAAPSNSSVLYAAFQTPLPDGGFNNVYTTVDGGNTWYLTNAPDFCNNGHAQCWYDMALAVSPVDPKVVYAGGNFDYDHNRQTTVVGSVDGFNTWTLVGASSGGGKNKVHTDTHAFAFTADGSTLFVGSDGGVWSGTPANVPNHLNWTGLNTTLATAQLYPGFALDANNASKGFGGTQDNGSVAFTGKAKWSNVTCGDGGFSAIDSSTNPSTYYGACSYSQSTCVKGDPSFYPCVQKSTNPGSPSSWGDASQGIAFTDPALFIPPLIMDPFHPSTLYYGTNRIWQTTNGGSNWASISQQPLPGSTGDVSAIAVAPSNSLTIYAGTSDGKVVVTTVGGGVGNWTNVSSGLPPRYVTHIAVDPNTPTTAYVTYSGFSGYNGDNQGHIFSTTNGGGSWTDISRTLPNIPVNDLVVDPVLANTFYAASDIGVFVTKDGGSSWSTLGTGLPQVAVLSLTLQQSANVLAAATHGRSVWTLSLSRPGETVLYAFNWNSDGANPTGGVVRDSSGNLYGALHNGGAYGEGSVFELSPSKGGWKETTLHSFTGGADGRLPWGGAGLIIDSAGNLYGTTAYGGASGNGSVFELSPSNGAWTETVLYSFHANDGYLPEAGLVRDKSGNLYGTTASGGKYGYGVAFELSLSNGSWTETVLHDFTGGVDGASPTANLILDKSGNLYGTTPLGGSYGWGTVFELTLSNGSWAETVLYSFSSSNGDGALPQVGLVFDSAGNLYGTTRGGGTYGYGTVFQLNPSNGIWTESILYDFGCGNPGCFPDGTLTLDKLGNLYSTTEGGGTYGYGTVFELTLSNGSWTESVLHSFGSGADGIDPTGSLIFDKSGNLYGTTVSGGGSGKSGVVFEVTP